MDRVDVVAIAKALKGNGPGLQLRQGEVVAVASDYTISVKIAGSATVIAGVKYASDVYPLPGAGVWLAVIGADLFAISTIAPVGPPYARVRRGTDQTIPDGADTAVNFTATPAELVDPWGMYSSPSTLVIPVAGLWLLTFRCTWTGNATGWRMSFIEKNGTADSIDRRVTIGSASPTYSVVSAPSVCARGDQIKAIVRQNSGGGLTIAGGNVYSNVLSAVYMGPA